MNLDFIDRFKRAALARWREGRSARRSPLLTISRARRIMLRTENRFTGSGDYNANVVLQVP